MSEVSPLPEHPVLAGLAESLVDLEIVAEILDHKWRIVFISPELARMVGESPREMDRYYGVSPVVRNLAHPERWAATEESAWKWWQRLGPHMVHDVPPDDPDFESVFGDLADAARETSSVEPPASTTVEVRFPEWAAEARTTRLPARGRFLFIRIHDERGRFVGVLEIGFNPLPPGLNNLLSRGDAAMFERMDELREPERRSAAVLFADLAGSGDLSRRISPRAYFKLIRSLTDLIDSCVSEAGGIVGKHAGDGASALFLADPDGGGESGAARAAITAARSMRDRAPQLVAGELEPELKVGLHWGATLMVGQVSTHGRLEVTALGDEMNEAARIESVAGGGSVLASKDLLERLSDSHAAELGIDLETIGYVPVAERDASEKAIRDAGSIAVAEV